MLTRQPKLGHLLSVETVPFARQVAELVANHGEVLLTDEAAVSLGIHRTAVNSLGARGIVRRYRVGAHAFYPVADLQRWKETRHEHPGGRGHRRLPVFVDA